MKLIVVVGTVLVAMSAIPAIAQTINQCATITNPSNGDSVIIQRLRCTIQFLDSERMQAADAATDAEVRAAIAEAKTERTTAEIDRLKSWQAARDASWSEWWKKMWHKERNYYRDR